jgi:hypothetical protein
MNIILSTTGNSNRGLGGDAFFVSGNAGPTF